MTKELADTIPPLYANDGADDPDAVVARVKLFSPLQRLALVRHRVGRRDRNMLRPRPRGPTPNSATSTSPNWRRRPCSAGSPPSSATGPLGSRQTLGEIRGQSSEDGEASRQDT